MKIFLYLGHCQTVLDEVGAGEAGLEDAEMSHLLPSYLQTSQILEILEILEILRYQVVTNFQKQSYQKVDLYEICPKNPKYFQTNYFRPGQ